MKKVYIVNGIHDGILSICTNIKRAYEITKMYNDGNSDEKCYEKISYSQMTKAFKSGRCMAYNGDCTVEWRYLNSY